VGHIQLFEYASRYGAVTVGINTDPYLIQKYGNLTIPCVNRAYVLRSIKYVDRVVTFSEEEPSALIRRLRPNFFIRGPDYCGVELPEAAACADVGTQIIIQCADKLYSGGTLAASLPASAFIPNDLLF